MRVAKEDNIQVGDTVMLLHPVNRDSVIGIFEVTDRHSPILWGLEVSIGVFSGIDEDYGVDEFASNIVRVPEEYEREIADRVREKDYESEEEILTDVGSYIERLERGGDTDEG